MKLLLILVVVLAALLAQPANNAAPVCDKDNLACFPADEAEFRLSHPIQQRPAGLYPPNLCGAIALQEEAAARGEPTPEIIFLPEGVDAPALPTVTPTPFGGVG